MDTRRQYAQFLLPVVAQGVENVVRIQPPLSITPEECERVATALDEVLSREFSV
jgi:4-aminobutyrate aminotransferase-like enzyme